MIEYVTAFMQVLFGAAEKRSEKGATAVEYGIMVALIAAVIIAVVVILGKDVSNAFQSVVNAL